MAQYDWGTMDPTQTTGVDLANHLNSFRNARDTTNSGSSRPAYVKAGTMWLDTSGGTVWLLKLFDGTEDITLFQIDTTTNVCVPFSNGAQLGTAAARDVGTDARNVLAYDANGRLGVGGSAGAGIAYFHGNVGVNGQITADNIGSMADRNVTISSNAPSGGEDGDVWLQYL